MLEIIKPFRPLLASDAVLDQIRFPVLASPKLDGIRGVVTDGAILSRSGKRIPNRSVQAFFAKNHALMDRLDGELIVGKPNAPDVYNVTNSGVMSEGGEPDFTFYVFDFVPSLQEHTIFSNRLELSRRLVDTLHMKQVAKVPHRLLEDMAELIEYEEHALERGYEGIMLRDPAGRYKLGRSTAKEGILLKLKRFSDGEAVITGFEERMHNTNEQTRSELGLAKRSSHKAGMVGTGTLGAFQCVGLTAFPGVSFTVSGFTHQMAQQFWAKRDILLGKVIKFKYFAVGVKDRPRFPGFVGFRDPIDM